MKPLFLILSVLLLSVSFSAFSTVPTRLPFCDEPRDGSSSDGITCQARNVYKAVIALPSIPPSSKKEITEEAYERWNKIVTPTLSEDGRWVAYMLESARGSWELVVRATQRPVEFRFMRGETPRARSREEAGRYRAARHPAQISVDSRFVLFTVVAPRPADTDRGLRTSLGIMSLPDGAVTKIADVSAFTLPKQAAGYVAYRPQRPTTEAKLSSSPQSVPSKALVLRHLASGAEVTIEGVGEFAFDEQGRYLAYSVVSRDPQCNGVFVRRLADGMVTTLLHGPGQYHKLVFDVAGERLAFLSDRDSPEGSAPRYGLYYSASPFTQATAVVPASAMKNGVTIFRDAVVRFALSGDAVTFGVAPERSGESAVEESAPEAKFELWHWKALQPLQQGRFEGYSDPKLFGFEQDGWYLAVYYIRERRWTQLGNELHPKVLLSDDARSAVGLRQDVSRQWGAGGLANHPYRADVYLIDPHSGQSRLLRRGLHPTELGSTAFTEFRKNTALTRVYDGYYFVFSPGERYFLYFADRRWWSVELASGAVRDLTGALLPAVRFDNEGAINPASQTLIYKIPYGMVGWTKGDRRVLLYSQRDIWEVDPQAEVAPRNLTAMVNGNVTLRLWRDYGGTRGNGEYILHSDPFIDSRQPSLLIGVDRDTQASMLWRASLLALNSTPELLLQVDKRVTPIAQARGAQQYLLTMERFSEYPDLWSGSQLDRLSKISDVNPQQREYRGGVGELIDFVSDFGVPLKGRLYKPEDFDPAKKYPMVVAIYERESRQLHQYAFPEPLNASPVGRHNWASAVSREYLYFVPDILSTVPYPGSSAVAAVMPAVQSMIDRGFADPQRIALSGASFGAMQTHYIITQTNIFRCAISDGGMANMLSLYGTSPVGPRFVEYGDMRMGGTPWDRPLIYLVNSALLFADRVQTPLLMMHNEKDGWPFSQAREFFTALHRNGKEVYLFNYYGEGHGLSVYANRLDWDRRVNAFLDHCLKDFPRSDWMQLGAPERTAFQTRHTSRPPVHRANTASRDGS